MTLTSAPVSTRKRMRLALSVMKNRQLGGRPEVLVANSTRPGHFPTMNRWMCTSGSRTQSGDGTSKVPGVGWGGGRRPRGQELEWLVWWEESCSEEMSCRSSLISACSSATSEEVVAGRQEWLGK